jgi:hypothetical protein
MDHRTLAVSPSLRYPNHTIVEIQWVNLTMSEDHKQTLNVNSSPYTL